jgi:RNA polymerase primary sigma factor
LIEDLMSQDEFIPWSESVHKLNSKLLDSTFNHSILSFEDAKQLSEILKGTSVTNEFEGIAITPQMARELLIRRNLKLVRQIALSMRNTFNNVEIEDLFQSGTLGLMRAVEKWDPDREFQFSTYATWHIRQAISRFTLDNYYTIRIPIHLVDKLVRVKRYLIQYIDFFNCEPEVIEAADALEISVSEYLNCREAIFFYSSYESELQRNPGVIEGVYIQLEKCELFGNPSDIVDFNLLSEDLNAILSTLAEREAGVIALRFGLVNGKCHTLDEIGKIYGVTRERIRQIESKVMAKLRHPARSELLREYLDLAEGSNESRVAKLGISTNTDIELDWDCDSDCWEILNRELFCGGW